MAAEILEQKARQATTDVMLCVRRVASALEVREKELLGKIEKARLLKFAALKARDEGLRNGIARLSRAADKLREAMESKTVSSNPLNLLLTKDMASAEVFIRFIQLHLKFHFNHSSVLDPVFSLITGFPNSSKSPISPFTRRELDLF